MSLQDSILLKEMILHYTQASTFALNIFKDVQLSLISLLICNIVSHVKELITKYKAQWEHIVGFLSPILTHQWVVVQLNCNVVPIYIGLHRAL